MKYAEFNSYDFHHAKVAFENYHTHPTFIIWSFIIAGPTNKRTAPKNTVRVPATINPIATLALLMAMIASNGLILG